MDPKPQELTNQPQSDLKDPLATDQKADETLAQTSPVEKPQENSIKPESTTETKPETKPEPKPQTTTTTSAKIPTTPPSEPPQEDRLEKRVSLRTTLLIIGLAILTAILLFVALKPLQKVATPKTASVATPTPSQAHSTLSMQLDTSITVTPTAGLSTKTVNVLIDTSTNKVEGVQFDISYDPTVLSNVTVIPGTFFQNPLVLLNQVDSKNGKIHYALGIQPTGKPQTGIGTVAVITFVMVPTKTGAITKLTFLPKTQVVQQGTLGSVLEKSIDLDLPTASLSPSTTGTIKPTATQ